MKVASVALPLLVLEILKKHHKGGGDKWRIEGGGEWRDEWKR